MTRKEAIQNRKNEALNKLMHVYSKNFKYDNFMFSEPFIEQRDNACEDIVRKLNKDLKQLKQKVWKNEKHN